MFLDTIKNTPEGKEFNRYARAATTYNAFYRYWRQQLFERIMRLFVWDGTGPVPPKEIEMRLILFGHCGITKHKNELTAFSGSFFGVTKYFDEFTGYTVHSPIYSGQRKIGKDIAVINANSLREPIYNVVHHYAALLAHVEVTLVNTAVNARDAGGVPIATTEKQKQSIEQYQAKLYNGEYSNITDIGNLGLQFAGSTRNTMQPLLDIYDTRAKLLKSFYNDIGVRAAMEKRSNTVEKEIDADTGLLLLNIQDMLTSREAGAEEVNRLYKTNWKVRLADEVANSLEAGKGENANVEVQNG